MDKKTFELRCQELVGQKITKVTYYSQRPFCNDNSKFHSLDFGLDLETANGKCFGITWDDEFITYGVSVKKEALSYFYSRAKSFDASQTTP
jgi:hypothetical protein